MYQETNGLPPEVGGPIRTLHVDIEGGWGGSSRSLWQLIASLDRNRIAPMVVHRQAGPVSERYAQIGVPTRHIPEIASYVPRKARGFVILAQSFPRLLKVPLAARRILEAANAHGAQLIHLNYEGLFLIARTMRVRTQVPMIGHCRAHLPESGLARWLARSLSRSVRHMFFISPLEQQRFNQLAGHRAPPGDVMWNIAPIAEGPASPSEPPEAIYLGNIDRSKGAYRLLEIAERLATRDAPPLRIAAYGKARSNTDLLDRLRQETIRRGLENRLQFRGHTPAPEKVLTTALALIRPSLTNDPWGRDVIEAAAHGVPVLATGSYQGVVEHDRTGFLFDPFDADAVADCLMRLASDPGMHQRLAIAALDKAKAQFQGTTQARLFEAVTSRLVAQQYGKVSK